jgi:cytochrome c peroxidase
MKQRPQALARRLGERCFYESTRSGIACQSCHLHADTDLAAYNLGDHRLIPTLGVRGLLGTAPYLRDGSYPRIGDLDEVAQDLYRGYPRNQAGRRYVLQSYVESLARELSVASGDHVAERRGYDVFLRARCARCHPAPAFTNLGQLPMAALFPRAAELLPKPESLDVPSLLSVSASAPYLHDGRAATLADVLDRENPDNMHGDTRSLSPAERADLLQFLSSL